MAKLSILIIGAGPGGEAAAKRAARRGAQVTLVDRGPLGGLCLNHGCIPSKALLESGRLWARLRSAAFLAGRDGLRPRWDLMQKRKAEIVSSLRGAAAQNYARLGVRAVAGEASFSGPGRAVLRTDKGEEEILFDHAVVAVGSRPVLPPALAPFQDRLLDSDRALDLAQVPARLLILGGGAVGCEFACLFHELGSRVSLVEKTPGLLPGEDPAVARVLQNSFEKRGIKVFAGATATALKAPAIAGQEWTVELSNGEKVSADEVLACVGRRPAAENLGLESAGVKAENGRIAVNEYLQTSRPNIYAVGDVNGLSLLAHAASAQGETAVDHIFGDARPYANHLVPRCLYTWPEVASVGEWAYSAEAKGLSVKSQRFFFQGSPKAMASDETEGFLQIVSEKDGGKILGAQIAGPHATELIHVFSVALQAGLKTEDLRRIIFAHPTLSEGIKEALSR
ncbi:MAG: dihydrolipoyl dehydrogenase [Elusimicrobiota bacterium]